jgi:hypothetical protein
VNDETSDLRPGGAPGARTILAANGAVGYSADMTMWQYAQLRVTYDGSHQDGSTWTIAWHGPDATKQDTAGVYGDVVAELNRAGSDGWELVDVAALEDDRRFVDDGWSLTRYTFRRPYNPTVARGAPGPGHTS